MSVFFKLKQKSRNQQKQVNGRENESSTSNIIMRNREGQLVNLMNGISSSFHLLKVLNASTDTLYLFDSQNMCIDLYDITHVTAVID